MLIKLESSRSGKITYEFDILSVVIAKYKVTCNPRVVAKSHVKYSHNGFFKSNK